MTILITYRPQLTFVEDASDHLPLQNALEDAIWERYGTGSAPNHVRIETITEGGSEDCGEINGHGEGQDNFDEGSE